MTHVNSQRITKIVRGASRKALKDKSASKAPAGNDSVEWPVQCAVGPGLDGAIACETKISHVNGAQGRLIYRGYNIFDLCANSSFEEVSYLLLYGRMPSVKQLILFKNKLFKYMYIPDTIKRLTCFPIEKMDSMAALRFGVSLLRIANTRGKKTKTFSDQSFLPETDENAFSVEPPGGGLRDIYEFGEASTGIGKYDAVRRRAQQVDTSCRLIAGVASLTATIARIKAGQEPLDPLPRLGHAGNLIYMMTGEKPTHLDERAMDVCLILHADHGMDASAFAALVAASTLADMYFSVGSGIGALSGQLHCGAIQKAYAMLNEIGSPENVAPWYEKALREKRKISGIGHRIYESRDPRASILCPLAGYLAEKNMTGKELYRTARTLEKHICSASGPQKGLFPNADYYSGLVYRALGVPQEHFTSVLAASRVSGWTARVMESHENNRVFRPQAVYTGPVGKKKAVTA